MSVNSKPSNTASKAEICHMASGPSLEDQLREMTTLAGKAMDQENLLEGLLHTCRLASKYYDREDDVAVHVESALVIAAEWLDYNRPCQMAFHKMKELQSVIAKGGQSHA